MVALVPSRSARLRSEIVGPRHRGLDHVDQGQERPCLDAVEEEVRRVGGQRPHLGPGATQLFQYVPQDFNHTVFIAHVLMGGDLGKVDAVDQHDGVVQWIVPALSAEVDDHPIVRNGGLWSHAAHKADLLHREPPACLNDHFIAYRDAVAVEQA